MMYTFIVNYRGGSYIEQVAAPDVLTATHIWAERIAGNQIVKHLDGELFRKAFAEDILEFPPMPISERDGQYYTVFLRSCEYYYLSATCYLNRAPPFFSKSEVLKQYSVWTKHISRPWSY